MHKNRIFRATATFDQLVAFSKSYMAGHGDYNVAMSLTDRLVFVLEATGHSILSGLIDENESWVPDDELLQAAVMERYYGYWLGYPCDLPYGFKWQSCSGAVLVARQLDDMHGDELFELECRPPGMRDECGFMDLLEEVDVHFVEVEQPQDDGQDHDTEPEWCPIDLHADRPLSYC